MQHKQPRQRYSGYTLIELALVMLVMGLFIAVAMPNIARALRPERDFYQQLSLWLEVILERSSFRGEVLLIEIDPIEKRFRVVRPVKVEVDFETGAIHTGGVQEGIDNVVRFEEIVDPFFPAVLPLPNDYEIEDVQGPDGLKIRDQLYYLAVYPYGWIDPLTIHLRDDDGLEHTGFINSVTGRIQWHERYRERIYEDNF